MPDRIEREIEDILSKIDDLPEGPARSPIPISGRSRKPTPDGAPGRSMLDRIDPANLMVAGAVVMVGGLALSVFSDGLIWVSVAGVVLFLSAFVIAFFHRPPAGQDAPAQGGSRTVYWRNRYIDYDPYKPGPIARIRSRLKRR
ncbi:MAG: hypothetical protein WEC33_09535 [Dehalococcoidia bacterium]